MTKAQQHAATLGGSPDEVEAALYDALQKADIELLMACWGDDDEIVCIHPGGGRLVGCGAIRAAFEALFQHSGSIHVHPQAVRRVESLASAVHSVLERIEIMSVEGPLHAFVLATNVYHKTPQGWRLVAHHASPGSQDELQDVQHAAHVLH